jgi:hypothetical protein
VPAPKQEWYEVDATRRKGDTEERWWRRFWLVGPARRHQAALQRQGWKATLHRSTGGVLAEVGDNHGANWEGLTGAPGEQREE